LTAEVTGSRIDDEDDDDENDEEELPLSGVMLDRGSMTRMRGVSCLVVLVVVDSLR